MSGNLALSRAFPSRYSVFLALFFLVLLALINLFQVEIARSARTVFLIGKTADIGSIPNSHPPLKVGGLDGDGGYIRAHFEFRPSDLQGMPNLFQTGTVNSGLRAEFAGQNLALLFPMPDHPGQLMGAPLAGNIVPGKWYTLDLEALDGSYIKCDVPGFGSYRTWMQHPSFSLKDIEIGVGFEPARRFQGDIRDVHVEFAKARERWIGLLTVSILKLLAFAGFIGTVYFFFQEKSTHVPQPRTNAAALYDPLLVLRSMACLLVILGHGLMIDLRPINLAENIRKGGVDWLLTASPWGGVWIFFTLSGYLMGKAFYALRYTPDRKGALDFYRNRLLRIVPLYWISVLIVAALVHPEIFWPQYWGNLGEVFLFDYDGQQSINPIGALWSVSTEMNFYLVVPIFYIAVARHLDSLWKVSLALFALLVAGLCFRIGVLEFYGWDLWPREVYKTLLGNIDIFLCGFFINYFVQWFKGRAGPTKHGVKWGFGLMGVLYLVLAYISAQGGILASPPWKTFLFEATPTLTTVGTSLIIILFETGRKDSPGLLAKTCKRIEIFGLLTYAIYVWHEPVLLAAAAHQPPLPDMPTSLLSLGSSVVVILLIASVMYYIIELPFERLKHYRKIRK